MLLGHAPTVRDPSALPCPPRAFPQLLPLQGRISSKAGGHILAPLQPRISPSSARHPLLTATTMADSIERGLLRSLSVYPAKDETPHIGTTFIGVSHFHSPDLHVHATIYRGLARPTTIHRPSVDLEPYSSPVSRPCVRSRKLRTDGYSPQIHLRS